jgi:hypothetical protein
MILGTFIKQPADITDYDVEYQEWLPVGDSLLSTQVTVSPDTITIQAARVVDQRVNIWLEGGEIGTTYKFTVNTTTAAGRVRQDEFRVKIKDY